MNRLRIGIYLLMNIAIVTSCDRFEIAQDDQISSGVLSEVSKLDQQVILSLKAGDIESLRSIMSTEYLRQSDENLEEFLEIAKIQFGSSDFSKLKTYYLNHSRPDQLHQLPSIDNNGNKYVLQFSSPNPEIYVSVFVSTGGRQSFMISNFFHKAENGWELDFTQYRPYAVLEKTAPQHYQHAVEELSKGYYWNAANAMELALLCLEPSGYWRYVAHDSIIAFGGQLVEQIGMKNPLPMELTHLASNPRLLQITPQLTMDGALPLIRYETVFELNDTASIMAENEIICSQIDSLIPGISQHPLVSFKVLKKGQIASDSIRSFDIITSFDESQPET